MADEKTPAFKTPAFWLSTLLTVLGIVAASGAFAPDSQVMRVVGLVISALGALGYVGRDALVQSAATKGAAQLEASKVMGASVVEAAKQNPTKPAS